MQMITLKIDGMHCSMCEAHVNDIIRRSYEHIKVKSSHLKNEAVVIAKNEINPEKAINALASEGYKVIAVQKNEVKKTFFGYKKI